MSALLDPGLPMLAEALSRDGMAPRLAALLGYDARLANARVVKHRPRRRAVVAYELEGPRVVTLYGKIRRKGPDHRVHELLAELRAAGLRPGGSSVSVPEPLAVFDDLHMTLQRGARGRPVGEHLLAPGDIELMQGVAGAIHALHRIGPPTPRVHTLADEIAILAGRLEALSDERPHWRGRLARLLDGCRRIAARLEGGLRCAVHRDFYHDQILIDGDAFTLIDLDLYAMSDPALDVGNFGAHLVELALRRRGDPRALRECEGALYDAYRSLEPRVTRQALDGYATLSLARHVSISSQMPDRAHLTAPLLDLCEERLGAPIRSSAGA